MPIEHDEPLSTPISTPTEIVMSANVCQEVSRVTIAPTLADSRSLGLAAVALDPQDKALEALEKLQQAMNRVDSYRTQYGALHNRFESAIDQVAEQSIQAQAARSRIQDGD